MRHLALATDYDGTLAADGRVDDRTAGALERVRATGRSLILVTGRIRADLETVFPRTDLFDLVVVENGATIWRPGGTERLLAAPPPKPFLDLLRSRGVPIDVGNVIVATREPHDAEVLGAIRDLGLDLQIIFNKGAVMVLPPGVTKASGLDAAVAALGLTRHEVVAIGDAENDLAMLAASECGAAVANALPAVKAVADVVTRGARGEGVVELVDALLADDLARIDPPRHHVELGAAVRPPRRRAAAGSRVALSPAGTRAVVVGSGRARTAMIGALAGRLAAGGYQVCLLDPEGTLEELPGFAAIGTAHRAPEVEEVVALLGRAAAGDPVSVAVGLAALPAADRRQFVAALWPAVRELRARTARPHWVAIDDAHHVVPRGFAVDAAAPSDAGSLLLATAHPERVSEAFLGGANVAIACGEDAPALLRPVATALGVAPPTAPRPRDGEALLWRVAAGEVLAFRPTPLAPTPLEEGEAVRP